MKVFVFIIYSWYGVVSFNVVVNIVGNFSHKSFTMLWCQHTYLEFESLIYI